MMNAMPNTPSPNAGQRGPRDDRGVVVGRIVDAARSSFAANGWAGTSMRAIARDAGVDPALVHYYFASKEDLLDAATQPPAEFLAAVRAAVSAPIEIRGETIVRNLLWLWSHPQVGDVLRSIVLTAAHEPRTAEKLRRVVTTSVLEGVAAELDGEARLLRASLVATQTLGLAMIRYVWRLEPIASLPEDEVVACIAPTIQRYLAGEL
jgi:AcrR family transcriptional regulator